MQKHVTNKPLSGIFIGSFDLLTGIRLCYQKFFRELTDQQIDEIVKISLSNVHRQEQGSLEKFAISTVEIQCYQILVVNIIFSVLSTAKNKFNTYYSVGLIFDSNKMRKNEHLNEMLIFWSKILAFNVKNLLQQSTTKQETLNIDYSSLDELIYRISDECSILIHAQIKNLPAFDLIKIFDDNFFAAALSSHLQTQMTTIIELPFEENGNNNKSNGSFFCTPPNQPAQPKNKNNPSFKIARSQSSQQQSPSDLESSFIYQSISPKFYDLFCFLAHFTLPSQLELSSVDVKSYPTPGLFLQCIFQQKVSPEEFISISPRPTTWIRLQNMKIYRTNEKLFSEQYKNAIQSNFYTSNENDTTNFMISPYLKPFWLISSKLKKDQINRIIISTINNSNCSPWAFTTVSMIQESLKFVKKMTADQRFGSLIRLALAFIAIKNEKLAINKENLEFLSMEQIKDIQKKELELESNNDFLIVVSIAQMYDKNTYKQLQLFLANNNKIL